MVKVYKYTNEVLEQGCVYIMEGTITTPSAYDLDEVVDLQNGLIQKDEKPITITLDYTLGGIGNLDGNSDEVYAVFGANVKGIFREELRREGLEENLVSFSSEGTQGKVVVLGREAVAILTFVAEDVFPGRIKSLQSHAQESKRFYFPRAYRNCETKDDERHLPTF